MLINWKVNRKNILENIIFETFDELLYNKTHKQETLIKSAMQNHFFDITIYNFFYLNLDLTYCKNKKFEENYICNFNDQFYFLKKLKLFLLYFF